MPVYDRWQCMQVQASVPGGRGTVQSADRSGQGHTRYQIEPPRFKPSLWKRQLSLCISAPLLTQKNPKTHYNSDQTGDVVHYNQMHWSAIEIILIETMMLCDFWVGSSLFVYPPTLAFECVAVLPTCVMVFYLTTGERAQTNLARGPNSYGSNRPKWELRLCIVYIYMHRTETL